MDALIALRFDANLSANTNECPDLGSNLDVLLASPHMWGNVDCKDGVSLWTRSRSCATTRG